MFVIVVLALLPSAQAARTWLKLQTSEVVIYSDGYAKDMIDYAVGYAAYRHAFRQVFAPPQPPPPSVVLLYRDLSTLQEDLPKSTFANSQALSFSTEVDGVALLAQALEGDRRVALQQTIQFDTIWSLRRSGYVLPIWMAQGAGEVLETMIMKKGLCIVGKGGEDYHARWQRERQIPWPRFFEVGTGDPEYAGAEARGIFHGQAWAIMHRILITDTGTQDFQALATKILALPPVDAVQAVLGVKPDDLEREIERHLRRDKPAREFTFDAEGFRKQLVTTPAPMAEVHVQLSDLLFATQKTDRAELELAAAQSLAPQSALVIEARARAALRDHETGDAVRRYRDAIAAGSTNSMAYFRSAEERLNDVSSGHSDFAGKGGMAAEEAAAEIRRGLQLDPSSAHGYWLLGRALYLVPDVKAEFVDEIGRGVNHSAMGESVRFYRAMLHERLGHADAALADLKQVAENPFATPALRKIALERVVKVELDPVVAEVERLTKEKQFDAARTTIAGAMAKASRVTGQQLERLQSWVSEREAVEPVRTAYKAKRWSEVVSTAEAFLEKYPKSQSATAARQMLDAARRHVSANGSVEP